MVQQTNQQYFSPSGFRYSLITRNRNPRVDPGKKIEIEIFLSGYGIPGKNKLDIKWSSPYVVDQNRPGSLLMSIAYAVNRVTGQSQVIAGTPQAVQSVSLSPIGVVMGLNKGYFMDNPNITPVPEVVTPITSEFPWGINPPFLLTLNISNNAPSGDYDVTFAFTYGDAGNLFQDCKNVPFHVTSRWERNQMKISIAAASIAFLSLLTSTIVNILK